MINTKIILIKFSYSFMYNPTIGSFTSQILQSQYQTNYQTSLASPLITFQLLTKSGRVPSLWLTKMSQSLLGRVLFGKLWGAGTVGTIPESPNCAVPGPAKSCQNLYNPHTVLKVITTRWPKQTNRKLNSVLFHNPNKRSHFLIATILPTMGRCNDQMTIQKSVLSESDNL